MIRVAAQCRAVRSAADGPMRDALADLHAATAGLARAVQGMAALVPGPVSPDDSLGEAVGVWADADYVYIEARLPADLGTWLDVSTCGRTLMVRIAKGDDHEARAAMPPGGGAGVGEASTGAL